MKLKWFSIQLVCRIWLMKTLKPSLKNLLAERVVVLDMAVEQEDIRIEINHGKLTLSSTTNIEPNVRVTYRSLALARNTIISAMKGDQFWLSALRDHRLTVSGDMSVLLWFFAICRHLSFSSLLPSR